MLSAGIVAFFLFALGDINDAYIKKPALKPLFNAGMILLVISTVCSLSIKLSVKLVWLIPGAVCLIYLVKALYFSFPAKETYFDAPGEKDVVDTGLYSMCRHPGVLFFAGLYLCLSFGAGLPLEMSVIYIILNLLLAAFEDKIIFPISLSGYEEYKKWVPFIIPKLRGKK